ncbi:MAG: thymidine kinase [Chitinophagales bacterium]|nr:thymidine kinase [Chitinophagales bacterium]MCZ2393200.1 thymidine kinase [Chitinophagales bacterium]
MFIEPRKYNIHTGWIEVICGSMFSGKTEELLRRLKRAKFAHQRVEIFKPQIDTRYHQTLIVSHDDNQIQSNPVGVAENILLYSNEVDVIGIDEAQFFDNQLPEVCNILASKGIRVIVAGLDMDFQGQPFGPMPALMANAEFITKVHAICVCCGNPAGYSYRLADSDKTILLGEKQEYEPRCRTCFNQGMALKKNI